jgi:hypothetical protein
VDVADASGGLWLGVHSLAVGRDSDQRFLFQLAERYGGQVSVTSNSFILYLF